jgi:hypothetical protein
MLCNQWQKWIILPYSMRMSITIVFEAPLEELHKKYGVDPNSRFFLEFPNLEFLKLEFLKLEM